MTALLTFPSPSEIAQVLGQSTEPSMPAMDLATLEHYYFDWPYPKSLDCWEGFVYSDLCEQLGWAHFKHEEYVEALGVWRICQWPSASQGERQALAQLFQEAYEEQSLIVGPPVSDLLNHGRVQLGAMIATLDDPSAVLGHNSSGDGFVLQSTLVQPDGVYHLRIEFDTNTVFYASFLPVEVHFKLLTARAHYQMAEPAEAASWLLRAAFVAQNSGLGPEAFSFLEKAAQLDPENQSVQQSLTNLRVKGISATLFSRVLVERTLFQPDPVARSAVRPQTLPSPDAAWLPPDWHREIHELDFTPKAGGKVADLGIMPLEQAKELSFELADSATAWPLLLPSSWELPEVLDLSLVEKRLSAVRGQSLEKLGLWRSDYRTLLSEMMEDSWPDQKGAEPEPEVLEFALPKDVRLALFGCAESWQIPTLLELDLPELEGVEVLSAWLRRLQKRWGARPFLLAQDIIWFQIPTLPELKRRETFLADLLTLSNDVAECFEPSMIVVSGPGDPYLFPVPLQLSVSKAP